MGVGGQRHAPAGLPPQERPGTHWIGGWVGLRAGLDVCEKFRPHRDSTPDRPTRSKSLYRLSYRGQVFVSTPIKKKEDRIVPVYAIMAPGGVGDNYF